MAPLQLVYVLTFGASALACYLSVAGTQRIRHADTRRGMAWLLVCSGTWAGAESLRLLGPSLGTQRLLYIVGLVSGLASIGAWLYLCSAYTGHEYHQAPRIRWTAASTYLSIVAVKVTNPYHGLYFDARLAMEPFTHLVIELKALHWAVLGLSYALSAIGFYLLFELFWRSQFDTRPLGVLVAITGLPAILDIVAYVEGGPPELLLLNYEPIGVAIFAIGVLFIVDERFVAVPRFWRQDVLDQLSEGVVVVGRDGQIRDRNSTAAEMFPELRDGIGEPLKARAAALWTAVQEDRDILAVDTGEGERYYRLRTTRFEQGVDAGGRAIVFADITDIERQRRALERQNEQMDDFASAITHELRNTLGIIDGYLDLATEDAATPGGTAPSDRREEALQEVGEAVNQMRNTIRDLTTLARYSESLDDVGTVRLDDAATAAWEARDFADMALAVETSATVEADGSALEELFIDAFRLAADGGARRVVVTLGGDGHELTIVHDGEGIDPDRTDAAFEYGEPVPSADVGMALPNIRLLARTHGWTVTLDESGVDGVRLVVTGITAVEGGAESG